MMTCDVNRDQWVNNTKEIISYQYALWTSCMQTIIQQNGWGCGDVVIVLLNQVMDDVRIYLISKLCYILVLVDHKRLIQYRQMLPFCWHRSLQINGLVQERCNSSALAIELRLSCTNPLTLCMFYLTFPATLRGDLLWEVCSTVLFSVHNMKYGNNLWFVLFCCDQVPCNFTYIL